MWITVFLPKMNYHFFFVIIFRNWYREAYDENGKMKEKPSLRKAILKTYGLQYMILGFLPAFCVSVLMLIV